MGGPRTSSMGAGLMNDSTLVGPDVPKANLGCGGAGGPPAADRRSSRRSGREVGKKLTKATISGLPPPMGANGWTPRLRGRSISVPAPMARSIRSPPTTSISVPLISTPRTMRRFCMPTSADRATTITRPSLAHPSDLRSPQRPRPRPSPTSKQPASPQASVTPNGLRCCSNMKPRCATTGGSPPACVTRSCVSRRASRTLTTARRATSAARWPHRTRILCREAARRDRLFSIRKAAELFRRW